MPEVQEVFRMATQKVRPDPGGLERQHGQQRRRAIRRKMGVYGLTAALFLVIAVVAVRAGIRSAEQVPAAQPSPSPTTAPEIAGPVGTVTFDGSTCSMQITADRIEPGVVLFEVVNATEQRAMFDSWQLLEGYTFRAFETTVERDHRRAEEGKPGHGFPGEGEVTYLQSDVIPANTSGSIVTTMSPGRHAIVCLKLYEGEPQDSRFRPFGIVGPIVVR
jgi:hypothetical protein